MVVGQECSRTQLDAGDLQCDEEDEYFGVFCVPAADVCNGVCKQWFISLFFLQLM